MRKHDENREQEPYQSHDLFPSSSCQLANDVVPGGARLSEDIAAIGLIAPDTSRLYRFATRRISRVAVR